MRLTRPFDTRMVQNFLLVWLDTNVDEINNDDYQNSIAKVVNTVNLFPNIEAKQVFMIASGTFGPITIPIVHDASQISSFYIFLWK
jgi:hypothetical protein